MTDYSYDYTELSYMIDDALTLMRSLAGDEVSPHSHSTWQEDAHKLADLLRRIASRYEGAARGDIPLRSFPSPDDD